jgi:glutathione peroxidase
MSVFDSIELKALDGSALDLAQLDGKATLVVNVASQCGLTPQYAGLEELQKRYGAAGFTVLGIPCNQFGGQEPGSAQEIATFCSSSYGVTFPLSQKIDVNGPERHPLYQRLVAAPDAAGRAGDVQWNFEKFVVSPRGEIVARFRPQTEPLSSEVVHAIVAVLPEPAPTQTLPSSGPSSER